MERPLLLLRRDHLHCRCRGNLILHVLSSSNTRTISSVSQISNLTEIDVNFNPTDQIKVINAKGMYILHSRNKNSEDTQYFLLVLGKENIAPMTLQLKNVTYCTLYVVRSLLLCCVSVTLRSRWVRTLTVYHNKENANFVFSLRNGIS
jgi:hypothetical protein